MIMAFIFYMSSEDAGQSTLTSDSFILLLFDKFPFIKKLSYQYTYEQYVGFIREAAHFTEFCALGFLAYLNITEYRKNKLIFYSFIFSVIYAISDEIHQLYIPGRVCDINDVIIDSCGALLGVILAFILVKIVRKFRKTNA